MYCNQCEQTAKGIACTTVGVCGKDSELAAMQDVLLYASKGLAIYANEAKKEGVLDAEVDTFTLEALFATLTNVNFDPERIRSLIIKAVSFRENIKTNLETKGIILEEKDASQKYIPASSILGIASQGIEIGLIADQKVDEDIRSLQQLLLYGLKGVSAYAYHAHILGYEDDRVYAYIYDALAKLGNIEIKLEDWLGLVLKCGEINYLAMELLDKANTSTLGHPVPTEVPLGYKAGKCILVSGHDLKDLKELLELTKNTGINIYTHGEMLPAHGYPELKKYEHLYGHFGTAWQNQKKEFSDFPGPILMTTNCIQEPRENYFANIYSTGPVAWPGVRHLDTKDFEVLIEKAQEMEGFIQDEDKSSVTVGFAHNTVLGVADKIVAAVKSGDIKHFFLVGGCDGAKSGRNYYTELVEKAPADTAILTLGCGKYRFFDKKLGDIQGIPRLLDLGQCNDAYSAVKIALALSEAFECDVNELPLSLVISWYEQKAVSILLSLLHLGIKNIRLGPSLPAFISPNVLNILVENYGIKPITTVDEDLAAILA